MKTDNINTWSDFLDFLDEMDSIDEIIYVKLSNGKIPVDNFELMTQVSSYPPEDQAKIKVTVEDDVHYIVGWD